MKKTLASLTKIDIFIHTKFWVPANYLSKPIIMDYSHVNVHLINVHHIFHNLSEKVCLPTDIKFDNPIVSYWLTNPIRSKILNFD